MPLARTSATKRLGVWGFGGFGGRGVEDFGVWFSGLKLAYLWLVGNGGMGTIISTTTTILPFPTSQRYLPGGVEDFGVWLRA